MAAKKRKETPQSFTLLDFFSGKDSSTSNTRTAKKPRVSEKPSNRVKREVPDEVIVIDSSDEDDIVEVAIPQPDPKPGQSDTKGLEVTSAFRGQEALGRASSLADLSARVCLSSGAREADGWMEGANGKSEDGRAISQESLSFANTQPLHDGDRQQSPFGFPTMLATQDSTDVVVPPKVTHLGPLDCSHDGIADTAPLPATEDAGEVEDALLGNGDWATGDDEMELFDVDPEVKAEDIDSVDIDLTMDADPEVKAEDCNSVDLDLTLEEDDVASEKEQPVESCPICERELAHMSTLVRHAFVTVLADQLNKMYRRYMTTSTRV